MQHWKSQYWAKCYMSEIKIVARCICCIGISVCSCSCKNNGLVIKNVSDFLDNHLLIDYFVNSNILSDCILMIKRTTLSVSHMSQSEYLINLRLWSMLIGVFSTMQTYACVIYNWIFLGSQRSENGVKVWHLRPGSAFIKPDQRNPWIKDQLKNALLFAKL